MTFWSTPDGRQKVTHVSPPRNVHRWAQKTNGSREQSPPPPTEPHVDRMKEMDSKNVLNVKNEKEKHREAVLYFFSIVYFFPKCKQILCARLT